MTTRGDDHRSHLHHAADILIRDIDAVKEHADHSDYKYKDRKARIRALKLLIHQYSLQNRTQSKFGQLAFLTPSKFSDAVRGKLSQIKNFDFNDIWRTGSLNIDGECLAEIQKLSEYAQHNYGMHPHGSFPIIWNRSGVESTFYEMDFTEPPSGQDSRERDDDSARSTPFEEDEQETLEKSNFTLKLRRSARDDTNSSGRGAPKSRYIKDESRSQKTPNKRRRTGSSASGEEHGLTLTPIASEEEFDIGETTDMMKKLSGKVSHVVKEILDHFRLPSKLIVAFNPEVEQPGTQEVHKACWGQRWRTVGKENCKPLPVMDALQSFVSAFLYLSIFQANGSRWTDMAKSMDGKVLYPILKSSIEPTILETCKTFTSEIASMVLRCDVAQLERYNRLLTESLPFRILDHQSARNEATKAIAKEFCDSFASVVDQLRRIAEACNPYETFTEWRDKIRSPLTNLIDHALQIKRRTAPTQERTFRFIWSEHGNPVDRDLMEAKAPSDVTTSVVVMVTLVPGLAFHQTGKQKLDVMYAAEILEQLREDKAEEPQAVLPATMTLD